MATTIHLRNETEERVRAVQSALVKSARVPISLSAVADMLVNEALATRAAAEERAAKGAKR